MATTGGLLNPEPSQPADREEQDLPPKSYAEAAEENLPSGGGNGQAVMESFTGEGEDVSARTSKRHMHRKSGSQRTNGNTKEKKDREVVIERFTDKDGEHLVSLQPEWDPAERRLSAANRTNSQLLSGRKAGARWHQSP